MKKVGLKDVFSSYFNRVAAWSEAGYGFLYSQAAIAIGHTGFGFLAPFHLILERLNGHKVLQKQVEADLISSLPRKNRKHQALKATSIGYRGLSRYVKTLSRLNEDFVMRPVANIFAIAGGLIGLVVGLPISLFGFNPPKKAELTEGNKFFATIKITHETRNFFGVLIWGAIAGYAFGSFYTAPITILGNTFQGASAFAGLFSGVATFIYELPALLENTWKLAKKLVTTVRDTINWVGNKLKPIGEFIADKLNWLLDKGLQFLNFGWQKLKAGFTKCYQFVSQALTWVKDQCSFVLNKIAKFLTVIKENGIRGLIAWVKEKTIGAAIRYFDNLSAVRAARSEIRTIVYTLLSDVQKTKTVFQLIGKQETDILPNKTDNLNLVMAHIEQIAEAHRTNYQHGNIQVKLNYLDTLKLNLNDLTDLSPDLAKLLDAKYLSWQSGEVELDQNPEPVDFLGQPSKTHLPQHKAATHQAQQQDASNDDALLDDELKSKKGSWFSCCRK